MTLPLPPLTADRARTIVAAMTEARVLVLGDVMLDHFIVGRVNRISPEAPVPVVVFEREYYRAGGAANVAAAEGARLANEAAGLILAKFGPATVTAAELLAAAAPQS